MSDEHYFSGYEDLAVHEVMLRDRPRQEAYYNAIMNNKSLFNGKVVLDVGAGTGILSIFCAKAGAKLVYAVEASKLATIAIDVVQENYLSSVVKVFQLKIEDFTLPPDAEKVDIIVSEWMGFYLLHEGMIDSVIYAREKFLKRGGSMFPDQAAIYVAPCSIPLRYDYWDNVDGVSMKCFSERLRANKSSKPEIFTIEGDDLLNEGSVLAWIDMTDINPEELNEISIKEVVTIRRDGKYQGFCIWFECRFPANSDEEAVVLSTSPKMPKTHWKQCVIVLPENACEDVGVGEPIAYSLIMKRNQDDHRKYNIEMNLLDQEEVDHPMPCDCFLTKCILTKAHLSKMEVDVVKPDVETK